MLMDLELLTCIEQLSQGMKGFIFSNQKGPSIVEGLCFTIQLMEVFMA